MVGVGLPVALDSILWALVGVDSMLGVHMVVAAVDWVARMGTALAWTFPYEACISKKPAQG
jgi:hypothetical protein